MMLHSAVAWASVVLVASAPALTDAVPDRLCSVTSAVRVDARTLVATPSSDRTIYRFSDGVLYLHPTDRPEYMYGKIEEDDSDPLRMRSGNKTILFDSSEARGALVVHVDETEVRTLRLTCR